MNRALDAVGIVAGFTTAMNAPCFRQSRTPNVAFEVDSPHPVLLSRSAVMDEWRGCYMVTREITQAKATIRAPF
jgi:hypothetical protein